MKKVIFLSLIAGLIMGSCTQEKKSPIEGAWELVYAKNRTMEPTYPAQVKGEQIKMWSKEHFTFVGFFEWDTLSQANFGWGTFIINGNKYEENIKFHTDKSSIGQTIKMLIDIQNDTLIQRWPTDENWNLPEEYSIEKYIRLD